jgi:hypothetical protein
MTSRANFQSNDPDFSVLLSDKLSVFYVVQRHPHYYVFAVALQTLEHYASELDCTKQQIFHTNFWIHEFQKISSILETWDDISASYFQRN